MASCWIVGETSAQLCRRNLGDVSRRHDARRADAESADQAVDDEHHRRGDAPPAPPGAHGEKHRGKRHHGLPSEVVGALAGDNCAHGRAEQDGGDRKSGGRRGRAEGCGQRQSTVPLITEASNPNRNPARVAVMQRKSRYPRGRAGVGGAWGFGNRKAATSKAQAISAARGRRRRR